MQETGVLLSQISKDLNYVFCFEIIGGHLVVCYGIPKVLTTVSRIEEHYFVSVSDPAVNNSPNKLLQPQLKTRTRIMCIRSLQVCPPAVIALPVHWFHCWILPPHSPPAPLPAASPPHPTANQMIVTLLLHPHMLTVRLSCFASNVEQWQYHCLTSPLSLTMFVSLGFSS